MYNRSIRSLDRTTQLDTRKYSSQYTSTASVKQMKDEKLSPLLFP
jgi:hypothetical protein